MDFRGDLDFSAYGAARNVSLPGVLRANGTAYFPTDLPGASVMVWSKGAMGTSVLQVLNLPATLGYGAATVFSPTGSCLSNLLRTAPASLDCSAAQPNSDAPGWSCTGPVLGLANEFPGVNRLSVWLLKGN
ncbi:hypothetical protein HYH02_002006 [Chlamydomonas schloesseri]|nr:hypothetical protein HYH02_002006 [Chlamydomonas schloesseri]|eukprot:KAG2453798.1 hypothetical protein HYH02_002006 [Chlamydomonas schloesseri]